jgi:hypothetical protein
MTMGTDSYDVLAKCRPRQRPAPAAETAIPFAVVVYQDPIGTVHYPDGKRKLTRCGRAALLRLEERKLEPHDRVCNGCNGTPPIAAAIARRERRR